MRCLRSAQRLNAETAEFAEQILKKLSALSASAAFPVDFRNRPYFTI
jgi:hypothetical protein